MAKLKLSAAISAKVSTEFEFIDIMTDAAADGSPIVRFVLKDPIAKVIGTQTVRDPVSGLTERLTKNDVEMVSVGKDTLDEIDKLEDTQDVIVWAEGQEGKAGTFKSNFRLDVSKSLEVWIVKDSFAAFGRKRRNEQRDERTASLMQKLQDAKTVNAFKGETGAVKPVAVAS